MSSGTISCPACGTENPAVARFCMACASPLAVAEPSREVRKVVTVVFADVTGSTGLGERLDPEALRGVMGRWFESMSDVLASHGGTVEKFIGDAVVAIFGVPVLHEDDALRAVRATVDMRAALATLNAILRAELDLEIAMRVGVNTGEVVVGDARAGGARATGDAVNIAARLQQAAEPGEIVLGDSTWRLVRDAVTTDEPRELPLRGREAAVEARRLVDVDRGAEAIHRRIGGPMVGRSRELDILEGQFERSVAEDACVLVTVLGSAGVGKSRLVHEFLAGVKSAGEHDGGADRQATTVLRGRCLPYGDGITWWPVSELLHSAVGLPDTAEPSTVLHGLDEILGDAPGNEAILARLAEPIGIAGEPAPVDELFWAVRRFLERLAEAGPLVVVLDDLQWADPTVLDLVEHVAEWTQGVPILLVAMARPELLEVRPGWGGGKPNATTFLLEPLPAEETEELVGRLLEGARLPEAARVRISDAADGNPLFVEQVIEMLLDDGALRRTADGTLVVGESTALSSMAVPPTIQALLAARLDRLAEAERRTIERAAVVGKEFGRLEVAELTPESARDGVTRHLMALVRKELIRPDRRRHEADDTFRFRHLLIRDAAYEGLPKSERADLHERFADWLERTAGDRLAEVDEIVGYHLEQARAYRLALGPGDERTRALGLRAGHRLAAAGKRAQEREEQTSAIRLLSRAEALLVDDAPGRFDALVHLADAAIEAQQYTVAASAVEALTGVAPSVSDVAVRRALIWNAAVQNQVDPEYRITDFGPTLDDAERAFEAAGEIDGLLEAVAVRHDIPLMQARWAAAADVARVGWKRAAAAGRDRWRDQFAVWLANAMIWGSTPIEAGLRTVDELLSTTTRRLYRASLLSCSAMLHAYGENRQVMEATWNEVVAIRDDLGASPTLGVFRRVEMMRATGQFDVGIELASWLEQEFAARGETGQRSTIVALAGWMQLRLGDDEEAWRLAEECRRLATSDDAVSQIYWRSIEAVVHARRGDREAADRVSDEAVALATDTDAAFAAEAWLSRAEVLLLAGRGPESLQAADRARDIYATKGYVNGIVWAEEIGERARGHDAAAAPG